MSFDDFLRWNNINLRIESLTTNIKGFAYYNGIEYLIIINSRHSQTQQLNSLMHEMIHIFEDHFTCPKGYELKCEKEVNYIIQEMKATYFIEQKGE